LSATGTTQIWRGDSQKGHLPPVCSMSTANMRSTEPKMALQ
jgi:hypothetical protein